MNGGAFFNASYDPYAADRARIEAVRRADAKARKGKNDSLLTSALSLGGAIVGAVYGGPAGAMAGAGAGQMAGGLLTGNSPMALNGATGAVTSGSAAMNNYGGTAQSDFDSVVARRAANFR